MHRYQKLFRYARPYRRAFGRLLLVALLSAVLVALQPWPMKLIVDHVLGQAALPEQVAGLFRWFSPSSSATQVLTGLVLAGLLLVVAQLLCESVVAWTWTRAGRRMVFDLSEELFARLQRRSLLYHQRSGVGETMNSIARDSWCAYFVFDTLLIGPLQALLAMTGMTLLMARLDGTLTLVALAIAPFMLAASFLVGKPLRAVARLRREIESGLASHVQQTLAGLPVVQAFSQEEREQERFQQFAAAAIRAQQRSTLLGSLNNLSSGLVTTLGAGVILWLGARHVLDGSLSVGSLLVFLAYLTSLQAQMKTLANVYTLLQGFGASVDRVCAVLDTPPEVASPPGALELPPVRGEVRLERVTFGYETGRPVLHEVSLDVAAGETVALVGATGAGKTTLVNLIPRFFDPWSGRVLIDGHDARTVHLESLRRQIGIVLQEPFLMPWTVAENIACGRSEATRAEIEAAARDANAHEFILRLPKGYDTVLAERGASLSGGERQRLAVARALLRNAPILILDEPTSALDSQTEHLLLEALERLMRGRTTLLIAHRLSTVRRANRIVVMQDGRIAESGSHEALLARGGIYSRLLAIQFPSTPAAGQGRPA